MMQSMSLASTSRCPPATATTNQQIGIRPLSPQISKFSERPVNHLKVHYNQTIQPWMVPSVQMAFLKKQTLTAHDGLYGIENYLARFEGSVTQTWMAILSRLKREDNNKGADQYTVLDAGMNTGFYTTLTAVMGYTVHTFDIQLDCFDVARMLVRANGVESRCNFYHLGLWSAPSTMSVQEGCDPGKGVDNKRERDPKKDLEWNHRTHNVSVLPLDTFLGSIMEEKKKIAILKMDIEGAEISALQGLSSCHLKSIQNIIMECAMPRIRRVGKNNVDEVKLEYQRLEKAGFAPYLLYQPKIPQKEWWDEDAMHDKWGVHAASRVHPILDASIPKTGTLTNVLTWKVANWDIILKTGACKTGCNLLFTRMATNHGIEAQ